jgi:guanylate kinase
LLEWACVHGAYYGTPKRPVLSTLARGRHVLLNIDVQGARQIRQALGRQAVLIFLLPPSLEALRERLVARRTETAATLRRRLAAARRELACAKWYDYCVVNDRLSQTVAALAALVSTPRRPVVRSRKGL